MFFNNMFVSNTATTSNADEKFALGVALLVECGRLLCFVIFVLAFCCVGRLLAKVGPRTHLNGSGSKNGAEGT